MWDDLPETLAEQCATDTESPWCWCGQFPGRQRHGGIRSGTPGWAWTTPPAPSPVSPAEPESDPDDDWRERESSEDDHIMWG